MKKKILMVLEHEFPGVPRVVNEIEILINVGYEVTVAAYTQRNHPTIDSWKFGKIIRHPISNLRYKSSVGALKNSFYFRFWNNFISDILKKDHFDALHIHDLTLSKPMIQLGKKWNIPVIIDTHENLPYLLQESTHTNSFLGKILCNINKWKGYEKKYLKKADHVITVVKEMRQRYIELGVNPNKISIYENVVNLNTFPIRGKQNFSRKGEVKLVYVGGINKHRGLDSIVKIMATLNLNISLSILGNGSYLAELKLLAKELNVNDKIAFHGWINFKDVPDKLVLADIALIPHKKSIQTDCSSPNKLYQYMACGLPVLSSNCDSIKRIIEQENIGFTYTWGDEKSLSDSIQKFALLDANEKKIYGQNGVDAVKTKYNISIQGKNLINLYQNLFNE